VTDHAIPGQRRVDAACAAHDVPSSEPLVKAIEMRDAVQDRDERTAAGHRRRDRVHRRLEVVGLAREQHEVEAGTELRRDHSRDGSLNISQ
jgi:hypothetical protein